MSRSARAGVYIISIAAALSEVHPRTLRIYEAEGLITPARQHGLRRYSDADLERVRLIRHLTQGYGVNLAGVRLLLALHEAGRFSLAELPPLPHA